MGMGILVTGTTSSLRRIQSIFLEKRAHLKSELDNNLDSNMVVANN